LVICTLSSASESVQITKEKSKIASVKSCVASTNFEIDTSDVLENIRLILKYILSKKKNKEK